MNIISKWTLAALCAAILAGCGSSQDKAEELIKVTHMDAQYSMIVQASIAGYANKYSDVPKDQIKKVVEKHLTKKMLMQTMADIYAETFDADELQLMIDANKHPETAMEKIMGSKDGMKLAQKAMAMQGELQTSMVKAFKDKDEDITEALDDLQEEARG